MLVVLIVLIAVLVYILGYVVARNEERSKYPRIVRVLMNDGGVIEHIREAQAEADNLSLKGDEKLRVVRDKIRPHISWVLLNEYPKIKERPRCRHLNYLIEYALVTNDA